MPKTPIGPLPPAGGEPPAAAETASAPAVEAPSVAPAQAPEKLLPGVGEAVISLSPSDPLDRFVDGETHLVVDKTPTVVRLERIGYECRARRPEMLIEEYK